MQEVSKVTAGFDPESWFSHADAVIHLNPNGSAPPLKEVPEGKLR